MFSNMRLGHQTVLLCVLISTSIIFSACNKELDQGEITPGDADFGEGGVSCEFDQDNQYSEARTLRLDQTVDGYICPLSDSDWYQLSIDQPGILSVNAKMETNLSPLNLTYEVYRIQNGETRDIVAQPQAIEAATQVATEHCVASGQYGVRIYDLNGDAQDKRNLYELQAAITPEPDMKESPTEGPADGLTPGEIDEGDTIEVDARILSIGETATAYIACRGDIDWFSINVEERSILTINFAMPLSPIQPQVTLYDPSLNRLVTLNNASAAMNETDLTRDLSLTRSGQYFLMVEDMTGTKSDVNTAYTLSVNIQPNSDINEPNNQAEEATPVAISALECGEAWSPWIELEGVIGTLGDIDWFFFETAGCAPGLLEVELTLNTDELSMSESFALQQRLGLSVSLVESHEPSPCNHGENGADESCRLLSKSCNRPWDCAGLSLVCLPEGVCAGSTACLPNNRCAATKIERHFDLPDNATEIALPAHRVKLSVPLSGNQLRYLRVSDYGGNAADTRATYSLRLRIREEPDVHEPSNIYTDAVRRGDQVADHIRLARNQNVVLIHDCSEGIYAPMPPEMGEEKEAGEEMAGTEMAGTEMAGTEMAGTEMAGTEMAGTEMAGTDMAGTEMAGIEMAGTEIAGTDMAGTDMAGTDMAGTDMAGTDMAGTDMAGTEIAGTEMMGGVVAENGVLPVCCSSENAVWTEGVISYEDDQDFYSYPHPCPGQDCMVKVYYEIEEGPVDMLFQIYEGDNLWFDPIAPVNELAVNAGLSGSFGGLEAEDQCFYAWQGHRQAGHYYTLSIRDLRPTRDWSTEQHYRFCIEKAGNGCFEPPCRFLEESEARDQQQGCSIPRR